MSDDRPILAFAGDHVFLSNFYYSPVHWEGVSYPTVEHAFQAAKTFDPEERRRVRAASSPAGAKRIGRRVTLRKDWESVKVSIVEQGQRSHAISARLSPLTIACVLEPKMTLEQWWQKKKCLAVWVD